ncbi:MAG TPA: hypothetical protein VI729_05960 [Anaerolineales bacterium]|nr:hypothetical protein [Anaerolineales bacterium]
MPVALAPLAIGAISSFLPSLLSGLFGGDPQAALRKRIAQLTSPENVGKLSDMFYRTAIHSPAYGQAQGTIAAGGNVAAGSLARELGARGIGTSGSAAVLQSLIPSMVGGQQAGLRTGAYQSAQERAMQSIQAQIEALTGTQGPGRTTQLFAGGLQAFQPLLQAFLGTKYPGIFGGAKT